MTFILLFIVTTGSPTYLGDYKTEESCVTAIRSIYEGRAFIHNVGQSTDREVVAKAMKPIIDNQMKFQREFICVKK